jgi:hypothetical protein
MASRGCGRTADEMLAKWDRRERKDDRYLQLGNVSGTLRLPIDPPDDCGMYCVSRAAGCEGGSVVRREARCSVPRARFYPFRKIAIGKDVPFASMASRPGNIGSKAIFDVAKPLHEEQFDTYAGEAGDYESSERKVIEVRIGEVTDTGEVGCATRIGG